VIVPLFRPPEGLTPAAARYVREQGFDDTAFSSALIGLAVKGRLRILDHEGDYRLTPVSKAVALSPGETKLMDALGGAPVTLVNTNHQRIGAARAALANALADEYRGAAFVLNRGWFSLGLGLSVLVLGLTYLLASKDVGGALIAALVFAAWWGFIIVLARRALSRFAAARGFATVKTIFGLLVLLPFLIGGLIGPALALATGAVPSDLLLAALGIGALAILNVAFFYLLTAPTPAGRALLDKIEGFRLYLATTEEDRLAVLNPPERTPALFERYLPYALALGCAHEWSEKFTAVLAAAGIAAPSWYSGSNWDSARPARFAEGLGSGLATSAAAAASPPGSSSGSGGGGSSGGGGGGGGGSGW
jgi:uncharacterized membrane protein YgcG